MAILPFAKVAAVAIKQVSKPLSKAVSDAAKNSRILSGGVEWLGQSLHRANVWTNRRSLGLGKAANAPPPLEQAKALSAGADAISEGFLFAFAIGITAWEYKHSAEKSAHKEAILEERLRSAEAAIAKLQDRVDAQEVASVTRSGTGSVKLPAQESIWSFFSGR